MTIWFLQLEDFGVSYRQSLTIILQNKPAGAQLPAALPIDLKTRGLWQLNSFDQNSRVISSSVQGNTSKVHRWFPAPTDPASVPIGPVQSLDRSTLPVQGPLHRCCQLHRGGGGLSIRAN